MADEPLTVPTTVITGPYVGNLRTPGTASYIGPGLPKPDVISGAGGGKPALLNADTNPDELSSLQPLALKQSSGSPGIQFPGLMVRESQKKSLAVHMYPNLDSARVENMGRDPAVFNIKAIFTNNIYPGQNETWTPGLLFPGTFVAIYNILLENNNIIFQHPLLGDITVQVHSWSYELNPKQARDGAIMEIELVETIGDNNPLSAQLTPPPGAGLQQSAVTLDTAIANAPLDTSPPTLSLSQFFGQAANLVSQAVAFPNNVVNSVSAQIVIPVINGVASVTAAFVGAPAYIVQNTRTAIQQTKNAVLNSPLQQAIIADQTTFGTNNPSEVFNSNNSSLPTSFGQSTYMAMQSIQHLNSTPSQSAFQLMNKIMRALVDLQQHYIDLNNPSVSPIIVAIRSMLLQVQQVQSALSLNTNNQNVLVRTYVTPNTMTWMQLSRYLNNPIDDLLGLNQGLIYDIWVPMGTTINYFQS